MKKVYYDNRKLYDKFIDACINNDVNTVTYLIDEVTDPSYGFTEALKIACEYGHTKIVKLLLKNKKTNPTSDSIITAVETGHSTILNLLLMDGRADPTYKHNTAIIKASENGNIKAVKLLMKDFRVDPSDQNNEALELALEIDWLDVIKELLKNGKVLYSLSEDLKKKLNEKGIRFNFLQDVTYIHTANEKNCPICLTPYTADDKIVKTKCDHIFHASCLLSWKHSSPSCPLCRSVGTFFGENKKSNRKLNRKSNKKSNRKLNKKLNRKSNR